VYHNNNNLTASVECFQESVDLSTKLKH